MGEWAADCSMRVRSNVVIFISSNVVKQKMSIKYLNPPKKIFKINKESCQPVKIFCFPSPNTQYFVKVAGRRTWELV